MQWRILKKYGVMMAKQLRSQRKAVISCIVVGLCLFYYYSSCSGSAINRDEQRRYIEKMLEEALKLDKGTGCEMPKLNPFSKEVTIFDKKLPKIQCTGKDWVKCYHSHCGVVDDIKETVKNIACMYRDILYESDQKYELGPVRRVFTGGESYELIASDHVKVGCIGTAVTGENLKWLGNTLGFRKVTPKKPPPSREDSLNVLIFAFDSTSRNGFIRKMPKSWKVLTEELGAVVMEGYNIVGDGTPAALFPILTGKTELELPDVRKGKTNGTLDFFPFIFYKLKEDGYRTAYFEDMPEVGTFQLRFDGFRHQPADHYLRAFYFEVGRTRKRPYCVGDTPQFKLMMNITEQFMDLDGKRFAFTFIADITHDNFNMVESADEDTAAFLRAFRRHADNTLLVVMGDHGSRYSEIRKVLQGKLEERLPLMALLLPASLVRARPAALHALRANANALTTPHDLHATILDVLGMRQHSNPYKLRGADLTRALTMLEPIPRHRSCSEAGIEPHWCACVNWQNVSRDEPLHARSGAALLAFINTLLAEVGPQCVPRTLLSIDWVLRQRPNSKLLEFSEAKDDDKYAGDFGAKTPVADENYQIKITTGPGCGEFEATMTYVTREDMFSISTSHLSRTNPYNHEPDCISTTHPHLNKYCYCRQSGIDDGSN